MDEVQKSSAWPDPSLEEEFDRSKIQIETPYGLQDGNGVDLTLIIENLNRTVTERLADADRGRRNALYILQHARRIR
jgi:hypothetical protein